MALPANHNEINHKTYFEEIGAWPDDARVLFAYIIGFVFSLALTLAAYLLAIRAMLTPEVLIGLGAFAIVQFIVQVVLFLHLNAQRRSRERFVVFCCALVVVFILVSGSLWIMFTLSGRMMPNMSQQQMLQYMSDQDGGI